VRKGKDLAREGFEEINASGGVSLIVPGRAQVGIFVKSWLAVNALQNKNLISCDDQ
jgi:hypothetical protein